MRLPDFACVVIGDLHGRLDLLQRALVAFGLADQEGRWTGGSRRLVQLGDLIDRGKASLAVMDLMMLLQPQAAAAGGDLTCLLGNHEAMALRAGAGCHAGRLQWALNGGWAVYAEWLNRENSAAQAPTAQAPAAQASVAKASTPLAPNAQAPSAQAPTALTPAAQGSATSAAADGSVIPLALYPPHPEAFYALFGPQGHYGRWLRGFQLATWVGEYVVVHAGWNHLGPCSVAEANRLFAEPTLDPLQAAVQADHLLGSSSPLIWARNQSDAEVTAACDRLGCRGLITGHTIQEGLRLSAGGRMIQIDVGMVRGDRWAAVALDAEGRLWGLLEGEEPQLLADFARPVAFRGTDAEAAPERLLPMPRPVGGPRPPFEPRFGPGTLVELYRSPGGEWIQYFYVRSLEQERGYPAYVGDWLTANPGGWSRDARRRPAAWIDQFARPVTAAEFPAALLADLLA